MALNQMKLREYSQRLMLSRMRILASHGFYGLLLTHMTINIDETCETAATDGLKIYFGPEFLENLSDSELDFVLMHEILHVVLQHCYRDGDRNHTIFNIATDIVVNSNIMESWGGDAKKITLAKYGEAMHITPLGDEGYLYNAEEVYDMIMQKAKQSGINTSGGNQQSQNQQGNSGSGDGDSGKDKDGKGSGGKKDKNKQQDDGDGNDSNSKSGQGNGAGQSVKNGQGSKNGKPSVGIGDGFFDDHSRWDKLSDEEKRKLNDKWKKHLEDALNVISITDASTNCGALPMFAQRILKERKKAQTDWRTVLNNFIQDEINDYSFSPPDRRFSDSDFFLPDFNEKDESVRDVLFMIDTSGSMSDAMITQAFDEIYGAIEQFNGKLIGWLGFFDASVTEPKEFSTIEEFEVIHPVGGGGTSFHVIFDYVRTEMMDRPPSSIVILTDGYAPFPKESEAMDIPVLWIINNEKVTPPWGKVVTIKIEE